MKMHAQFYLMTFIKILLKILTPIFLGVTKPTPLKENLVLEIRKD